VTDNSNGTEANQLERPDSSGPLEAEMAHRSQIIAEALDVADLNALRITLYQLTGNLELREMPLETIAIRNGRVFQKIVHPDYQDRLKELAAQYLSQEHREIPPVPDQAGTLKLIALFEGQEVPEKMVRLATENLALADKPAELAVSLDPGVEIPEDFHVTIIGAGHTGVAMAIYMQQLGIPFTIVEKHDSFGGTWVKNHYPNLRVDVPGYVYQYRFIPYNWNSYFPSQNEIKEYANFVADRYGLRDHARLSTAVEKAEWDAETGRWTVGLSDGSSLSSNFVISASGLFANASMPDIPGISRFKGRVQHTAAWNDDFDATGKRIALIGNGSSGTQLMPWLAERADKLYAFQRTAQWIVPPLVPVTTKISPRLHWLMDNLHYYRKWHIYSLQVVAVNAQNGHELDPAWKAKHGTLSEHNDSFRANLKSYIAEQMEGRPDLIEKSIPASNPLARRLIVDAGWYRTLTRPNVELVTTGIAEIDETGIRTVDGEHYDLDAIVLGSGFDTAKYFFPVVYKGENGVTFDEAWRRDGPRAYLGMSHPEFPNFFSCYGPNSHPRSGSFHVWTEAWARYVSTLILSTLNKGAKSLKVQRRPFETFNEAIDERFKSLVWGAVPGGGYYINEHGRPGVHMPFRAEEYYELLANPKIDDYAFE
jgi:4-hydroxyacetophenone monooxygenase